MPHLIDVYRWMRSKRLIPDPIHRALLSLRSFTERVRRADYRSTELSLVRMALGEVRDKLDATDIEVQRLREEIADLKHHESERLRLFSVWSSAFQEGRELRDRQ